MTEAARTKIVIALDSSGSMGPLANDVIGGYNTFIEEQRGSDSSVTLLQFSHELRTIYEDIPVDSVEEMTRFPTYGGTALLDAMGTAITKAGDAERAIIVVMTDGEENSSREFNREAIKTLIANKPDWQFVFLGADMDGINDAGSLGFITVAYDNTGVGTRSAYANLSNTVSTYVQDDVV